MSYKNITLIGPGGNLGPTILKVLSDSKAFNITVLSRKSSKAIYSSTTKVIQISDDYPASELETAFKGQDAVLSYVGGEGVKDQIKFIDACIKVGVKRFFPSEYGTSLKSPKAGEICPPFKDKVAVTDYLKKQEGTGLTWTAVVNGPFFDWGLQVGFLGFDLKAKKATIYDGGDQRWGTTNLTTIGRALSSILQNPSTPTSTNKFVYIASFTTSQNEILSALEKISGSKYTVEQKTTAKAIEEGRGKLGKGDFSGIVDLIIGNLYGGEGNDYGKDEGLVNEAVGLEASGRGLEEQVRCVVETGGFVP